MKSEKEIRAELKERAKKAYSSDSYDNGSQDAYEQALKWVLEDNGYNAEAHEACYPRF